jgi:choline dehydrogenase-like flavoprotein
VIIEHQAIKHDLVEEADAVVVGSGCGGATVAKELAQAGWRVVFLDAGGYYTIDRGDMDQREDNMLARIDGGRGMHSSANGQVSLTYGNNVGGASVHYWADTWRTPKDRLDVWERDYGVTGHTLDELTPFFERIESDLNVHAATDDRMNRMNHLFAQGAHALGIPHERVMQARKNCIGSGYCMQGCSYNAKQSQLVTYVPMALAAGARLYSDCRVDRVLVESGRTLGVQARFMDRRTAKPNGFSLHVKSRCVILAAGGYHTAAILMRSKVPNPSDQLGKNLRSNPCPMVFGLFPEDVVMWRNIPAAVGSMHFRLPRFENGKYQEGGYLLYPNQLPPASLAALLPGFGKEHRSLMEQAPRIGSAIAWIDDVNSGSMTLDDEGHPIWNMRVEGVDDLMARDAMKKGAAVLLAAGAKEVIVPDAVGTRIHDIKEISKIDRVSIGPGQIMYAAPHPCGMTRMGSDPAKSVVNNNHEHHQVKGLFVCDPSVFPTAPSVDPSETIMAFSYIAARHLQEKWSPTSAS